MSLRREPDEFPVEITIPVGPWPAGPAEEWDKKLSPVDLAAKRGSVHQRRFDRPGNYLIRLRQSDFKLPDPVENEPLTYDRRKDADHPADSPLPPPTAIRLCLPDFASCDSSRCADLGRFDYHANGDDVEEGELGECHKCGGPDLLAPRAELHPLPCGHMLCSTCLSVAAISAVSLAHCKNPVVHKAIRDAAEELGLLRRERELGPGRLMTPRRLAEQEARMDELRAQLLEELGLSCCGVDMHLSEDWYLCLEEWLARSLWAVTWRFFRGEGQVGVVRCSWRDCRAAIPPWCSWLNSKDELRWHCVSCRGNSMRQSGGLAPAR